MEENEGECTTKAEEKKGSKKNSWQWAMHACLFSDPLQGKYFSGLSSQQRGL